MKTLLISLFILTLTACGVESQPDSVDVPTGVHDVQYSLLHNNCNWRNPGIQVLPQSVDLDGSSDLQYFEQQPELLGDFVIKSYVVVHPVSGGFAFVNVDAPRFICSAEYNVSILFN